MLVNLCFIVAALACAFGLPRRLAGGSGAEEEKEAGSAKGGEEADGITRARSG